MIIELLSLKKEKKLLEKEKTQKKENIVNQRTVKKRVISIKAK